VKPVHVHKQRRDCRSGDLLEIGSATIHLTSTSETRHVRTHVSGEMELTRNVVQRREHVRQYCDLLHIPLVREQRREELQKPRESLGEGVEPA
jgi:hypothetical protein